MDPLKHVLIVCHPRTGGTWFGGMWGAHPKCKFLWEPDLLPEHGADSFRLWRYNSPEVMRRLVTDFSPHCPTTMPEFPHDELTHACYKLITVNGMIGTGTGTPYLQWGDHEFGAMRAFLDAKVIHLVRHPLRWMVSAAKTAKQEPQALEMSVDTYCTTNAAFAEKYSMCQWYARVTHEELISGAGSVMRGLTAWAKLPWHQHIASFIVQTQRETRVLPTHEHSCYAQPEIPLEGWRQAGIPREALEYANRRLKTSIFSDWYDPLGLG